jgi:hypothetical protein
VDGLRADSFREMLEAGMLPNIQRHLVERGTMVADCAGAFPSTTGPAHLPFINGRMPGNNNCPGLRWIDRNRSIVRDYCTLETVLFDRDFPPENYTLYELLHGHRTVCIFDFVSRGASEYYRPSFKTLWNTRSDELKSWQDMDREAAEKFEEVLKEEPIPTFTFVWMPAIDHLSHLHGEKSDQVETQAGIVDGLIGEMMTLLETKGIYDRTLVALAADHGLRKNEESKNIRGVLREAGFSVLRDLGANDEFNSLGSYNAARGVSGNGSALLYFAREKKDRFWTWMGWEDKPTFEELQDFPVDRKGKTTVNLFELLREQPSVKFVLAWETRENPELRTYRVFTASGDARIKRDEFSGDLEYRVISGPDPLGYSGHPQTAALMDNEFHDKDAWFAASRATDYPDALFQISQLFDADRCGDIVLSSAAGYDFMSQGHRATHGGLERDELMVPCVVAGPGIRAGETVPMARTVDIFSIFADFFRIPRLDGKVPDGFKG